MMRVFMVMLCSLMAVCSVSARISRREGRDGQAEIYRLPLFHDESAGGRASAERLAEVLRDVPAVRERQPFTRHACLQRGSIPAFG